MRFEMLIDGQWQGAQDGGTWDVINPATEEVITTVPFGGEAEARAAVDAAHKAQPGWAAMTAYQRGEILQRVAQLIHQRMDELAPILTREAGKPLAEARGEWTASADLFSWFAEEGKRAYGRTIPARKAKKRLLAISQPVGVVGTITAWNFPAYLPARKWSAALAAGCAVVGRPSELAPLSAMALANLMAEAGIPPGVFNLINGDPAAMARVMFESPYVDKISFTGSQAVGRLLMRQAADGIKRLALELGGSAPVLVFADADVEQAAKAAVQAKFRNAGQVCISPSQFYIHEDLYVDFLAACAQEAGKLVVGNGLDPETTMGPVISSAAREKLEAVVADAVDQGGRIVFGGERPAHLEKGFFYAPTILTDIAPAMRICCEEVFGPVMAVGKFKTVEEAIQRANDTPFGLAGYIFTRDLSIATRAYEQLRFGIVGVNDLVPATAEGPFGPMKQSGFGREGAVEGLREFMETKFVSMVV